jgi:hypothetical protein
MEKIRFKEKRSFSEIMNVTFTFLKLEFKPLLRILLFTVAPLALALGILVHIVISYFFDAIANMNNPSPFGSFGNIFLNLGLAVVAYFVTTIMVSVVVLGYIKVYVDEKPENGIELKNVAKYLKWDFWRVMGAAILLAIIGFFVQLFISLIPFLGIFIYSFLMFFITAITYLTYMIMVYERKGVINAFTRSFDLIADYWWVSFGLVAVTMIIQYSLAMSVAAPSMIAYGVYMYHSMESINTMMVNNSAILNIIGAIFTILAAILMFLLQSITLTAMAFHYFNLVESKEGIGLMEDIDKIGSTQLADEGVF